MLVNKDEENSHAIHIAFHDNKAGADSFLTGPVNLISFGSEQYQWHPDDRGGRADPDGPVVRSTVTATADTEFTLHPTIAIGNEVLKTEYATISLASVVPK